MLAALCAVINGMETPLFSIHCLHVEHGIRPEKESRGDADFVADFCKKLGIPCKIVSIPVGKVASMAKRKGIGIEAAARFFRRRALFRQARRLEMELEAENAVKMPHKVRILTGHTKDDLLETALMRVFRGAGPQGLGAIPVSRGRILRPLLGLSRVEVLDYLAEKKIPWRQDSTNADTAFLRNRIRHELIPVLNAAFPFWKSGLCAMAQTQALAAGFIKNEAKNRLKWEKKASFSSTLSVKAEDFFAQNAIIREEALFAGINMLLRGRKMQDFFEPKRSVIRRFSATLVNAADLGPLKLKHEKGRIFLSIKGEDLSECGFSLLIKQPGLYILKGINIEVRPFKKPVPPCGFYASLPLVFRQGFKDDFLVTQGRKTSLQSIMKNRQRKNFICAVDNFGAAAFIGPKGFLLARDMPLQNGQPETLTFFSVLVKKICPGNNIGGINV